jgi:Plavaka transposase
VLAGARSETLTPARRQKTLPDGATLLPIIASSDETQLNRMCRTENAYPGYFTLGNFHNPTRKDTAIQAMILLFSLPILHSTSPICLVLPYNPFSSW